MAQSGAKTHNLLKDPMVCQDSQRGRRNINKAWIDVFSIPQLAKGDVLRASLPAVDRKLDGEA